MVAVVVMFAERTTVVVDLVTDHAGLYHCSGKLTLSRMRIRRSWEDIKRCQSGSVETGNRQHSKPNYIWIVHVRADRYELPFWSRSPIRRSTFLKL